MTNIRLVSSARASALVTGARCGLRRPSHVSRLSLDTWHVAAEYTEWFMAANTSLGPVCRAITRVHTDLCGGAEPIEAEIEINI